ncbi:MAG: hypothetical protein JXQ26_02160 [Tissierellales bacterium]|nr:hypothetical protein [Tissierellales bacterium]
MGYRKLLWGFIFLFEVRIGGGDVLPDVIAYILFYQGLSQLSDRNDFFKQGKAFTVPLMIMSIFDIYQPEIPVNALGCIPFGITGMIFVIIALSLNMLMVYNICFGITKDARDQYNLQLETQSQNAWHCYLVSSLLLGLNILSFGMISAVLLISFCVVVISYILMVRLTSSASRVLE